MLELIDLVRGRAKIVISGLEPIGTDFDLAWSLLEKEYKREPLRAAEIFNRLKALPYVSMNS